MSTLHRIVVVGAGNMGSLHARVISQSDRACLARIVEPREDIGREAAARFSTQWAPELGSLSDVDAVVLASATESHHELALHVLGLSTPLLVEKPISNNLTTSEEIISRSAENNVPLMCGLLERYNPAVMTARALVSNPVHMMARRHGPYAPRIKTGVSWDLLVHDVDIAIQFFGGATPNRVASTAGFFHPSSVAGAEDTIETLLSFPNGLATVSASRLGQRKVRSLVVTELERSIEIDLLRRDVTIYRHVSHDAATPDGLGYRQQTVIEIPELISAREPLATQLDRFVDMLDGTADPAIERDSILPAHRVVASVLEQAAV